MHPPLHHEPHLWGPTLFHQLLNPPIPTPELFFKELRKTTHLCFSSWTSHVLPNKNCESSWNAMHTDRYPTEERTGYSYMPAPDCQIKPALIAQRCTCPGSIFSKNEKIASGKSTSAWQGPSGILRRKKARLCPSWTKLSINSWSPQSSSSQLTMVSQVHHLHALASLPVQAKLQFWAQGNNCRNMSTSKCTQHLPFFQAQPNNLQGDLQIEISNSPNVLQITLLQCLLIFLVDVFTWTHLPYHKFKDPVWLIQEIICVVKTKMKIIRYLGSMVASQHPRILLSWLSCPILQVLHTNCYDMSCILYIQTNNNGTPANDEKPPLWMVWYIIVNKTSHSLKHSTRTTSVLGICHHCTGLYHPTHPDEACKCLLPPWARPATSHGLLLSCDGPSTISLKCKQSIDTYYH